MAAEEAQPVGPVPAESAVLTWHHPHAAAAPGLLAFDARNRTDHWLDAHAVCVHHIWTQRMSGTLH